MTLRSFPIFALASVGLALTAPLAQAAQRPQTTPLADANLFISPCGQPFRSKPGEPYPVVAWFAAVDTNKDGKIDKEEFKAEAASFFKILDINKDGVVTDRVINYYEKNIVPEINVGINGATFSGDRDQLLIKVQRGGGGQIDPGGGSDAPAKPLREDDGPPKGAAMYGLLNDPEPIRSADRSLLGRVRLQDFLDLADRNFDALDYRHQGFLTLEDLPRTAAQKAATVLRKK